MKGDIFAIDKSFLADFELPGTPRVGEKVYLNFCVGIVREVTWSLAEESALIPSVYVEVLP